MTITWKRFWTETFWSSLRMPFGQTILAEGTIMREAESDIILYRIVMKVKASFSSIQPPSSVRSPHLSDIAWGEDSSDRLETKLDHFDTAEISSKLCLLRRCTGYRLPELYSEKNPSDYRFVKITMKLFTWATPSSNTDHTDLGKLQNVQILFQTPNLTHLIRGTCIGQWSFSFITYRIPR